MDQLLIETPTSRSRAVSFLNRRTQRKQRKGANPVAGGFCANIGEITLSRPSGPTSLTTTTRRHDEKDGTEENGGSGVSPSFLLFSSVQKGPDGRLPISRTPFSEHTSCRCVVVVQSRFLPFRCGQRLRCSALLPPVPLAPAGDTDIRQLFFG